MPPIVKDSETAVATPISAAPATTAAKTKDESPARPQPVALEVPVTVNGARTVEGSDKREPFSENTKTVLVFSHGAVIRLASTLAPGQLIFLTNEKTKKEVVCQVIKSKNYRSVTGYVELQFTEPATGFWGMRFPADRLVPAASVPALPSAAPRTVVPAVPVPPKVTPPPPPAPPVAAKPAAPVSPLPAIPAPAKLVVPPPSPAPKPAAPISPTHVNIVAPPPAPPPAPPAIAPVAEQAVTVAPVVPSLTPPVTAKPQPVPIKRTSLSVPAPDFAAAISSLFDSPVVSAAKPAATEPPKIEASSAPAESSTEQLKLQTARLQEQLSSLLFTETPVKPPTPPAPAVIAKTGSPSPEAADKLLQFAQAGLKPTAPPEIKPVATARHVVPPSLAAEQVKVPAWLAPLAHESESTTAEPVTVPALPTLSDSLPASLSASADYLTAGVTESHPRQHSSTFGGQLLGESSLPTPAVASRSKKGLFIGIAATLLLAAGVVWYMRQPDNLISSLLASKTAAVQTSNSSPAAVSPSAARPAAPPVSITKPAPAPASSSVIHSESPANVVATAAPAAPPEAKNPKATARATTPVEEPKKPAVGQVHLATPVVNRAGGSQADNEAEPSMDVNQSASADPLAGLAAGHRKEPIAPLPVGGDFKQARLLKSVSPIFPPTARAQNVSGEVKIEALIDVNGNVSSVKIISGPTLLHQAALNAVKQWKYDPAQLNGKPTAVNVAVTVHFRSQ
ncbi:MAG TPA: TonB family protein [Candidatus Acidoferrum sp.]|nr:TonB family protein [Candidatus Acidoferrum sp.]